MNPIEALQLQLRLEGFEIVGSNRLRQVEVVPDEEMPLLVLARLADGAMVAYLDESLNRDFYLELMEQMPCTHFPSMDAFINVIAAQNIPFQIGHYKTNLFPAEFLEFTSLDVECRSKTDPRIQKFGFGDFAEHVYVIEQEGRVVSACVSTRENERCGEAWVCTDPHYRHQGLAGQVAGAWARDMLSAGKVPFYSHRIDNTASAGLAKHLRLVPAFEELVISYADASVSS